MVNVHATVRATATQLARQLGDIVIAGALLVGTMPLLLMVALAIVARAQARSLNGNRA